MIAFDLVIRNGAGTATDTMHCDMDVRGGGIAAVGSVAPSAAEMSPSAMVAPRPSPAAAT